MGTWTISPNDGGATIDANSGAAVFRENTSTSNKDYKITFNNGTCSCVRIVTIAAGGGVTPPPPPPTTSCSCDDLTVDRGSLSFTSAQTTEQRVYYTIDSSCTLEVETDATWINVRDNYGSIDVKVEKNETANARSGNVYFKVDGNKCTDTSKMVVVNQEKGEGTAPPTPTVCNPDAYFTDVTCDGNSQCVYLVTRNACSATMVQYKIGTIASGAFRVDIINNYKIGFGNLLPSGTVRCEWWAQDDPSISGYTDVQCTGTCGCSITVEIEGMSEHAHVEFGSDSKTPQGGGLGSVTVSAELPNTLKVKTDSGYVLQDYDRINGYSRNYTSCPAGRISLVCCEEYIIRVKPFYYGGGRIGFEAKSEDGTSVPGVTIDATVRYRCNSSSGWEEQATSFRMEGANYTTNYSELITMRSACADDYAPDMEIVELSFPGANGNQYFVGGSYTCYTALPW